VTCIIGVTDGQKVTIGGDSAGVGGTGLTIRSDRKVWKGGGWAWGFTTSFRMGQILRYSFTPPPVAKGSLERYMTTSFVDGVRQALKDGGWATTTNGNDAGGTFLVGHEGRLFAIHSDFQVEEAVDGILACGCGDDLALGAMYALPSNWSAQRKVRRSLEVAAHLSSGVAGPFHVVTT
jgi:ATP-dependent protease HslVU (ClpYQ) peptidase subunit